MNPLYREKLNSIEIEVYGGWEEIGGNCIVVKDGDKKIVFDNGIRFSVFRSIYSGRIEPLGPTEMRSLGVIPDLDVYSNAESLYISHAHLDHVGLLSSVPPEVEVVLPSIKIFEDTLFDWYKGSSKWLSYIPPDFSTRLEEAQLLKQDKHNVISIPVSHSAYPSRAYLYLGKDASIFYSGDLRLEPLAMSITMGINEAVQKIGLDKVDIAIVEGTNFDVEVDHFPVTAQMFRESLALSLATYELVVISIDPLDLELFVFLTEFAEMFGRRVVVASKRILWMLRHLTELGRIDIVNKVLVAEELETPTPVVLESISLVDDVFRSGNSYVLVIEPIALLDTLRKLRLWRKEISFTGSIALLSDPEPREAVKEVEESVVAKWLRMFGFKVYRLRLSGHYYPHDFTELMRLLKPRRIIPVHTTNPGYMLRLFEKMKNMQ